MRNVAVLLAGLAVVAVTWPGAALAQGTPGATVDGQELAAKLCASCHATDPQAATIRRADVPTFRAIANGPNATPERLAAAIILPHPEMPGVPLTRAETRALIDYILSLKQ